MLMTFNWKTGPMPVPMDHWMVAVKYTPKDVPKIGKGRWTLPIKSLEDKHLIQSIITHGIRLWYNLDNIEA